MRRDNFPGWGLTLLFTFTLEAALLWLEDGALETMLVWEEMLLRRSKEEIICLIRDIFFLFSGTSESSPNPRNSAVDGRTPPTPNVGETPEVSVW